MSDNEKIKKVTCQGCPNECVVEVTFKGTQIVKVEGNFCPTGEAFARSMCREDNDLQGS